MPIIVNLDVMMAKRKMSLNELYGRVDLTLSNLSILKTEKAKAIRFSTLEAICKVLDCQPGDILEFVSEETKTTNRQHGIAASRAYGTQNAANSPNLKRCRPL
ncbi:helix-turn-helix domain-containing protein [Ilyomonas limi]